MNKEVRDCVEELMITGCFPDTAFFMQHGRTSVMTHCINVAELSLWIADYAGIPVNRKALVRGALLHDYFLYDWHRKYHGPHHLHGFHHPYVALENAMRDYEISVVEKNIIVRHMFPLTIIPPTCREAWIVCLADKIAATKETFDSGRG